jgi:SWI/SNF-related matrix-associated actin-dependent regulator 1 of chromatin subfamily A
MGRKYNKEQRFWTVPATPWHCNKVKEILSPHGFIIDPEIEKQADCKADVPELDYPKGMYKFQKQGVKFIFSTGGRCIIADEMGLGKTVEALAYVHLVSSKTLIIAPANVIYKWEMECKRWVSDKTVGVYPIGKGDMGDENIHIMSYGIMASRYEQLKNIPYDTVIFDEAHMVKNSKAIRTRVSRALVKGGIPNLLFLSGTPFMNRPSELFPLLNMLDPVGFSNFYQYATRYCGAQYIGGEWYFPPDVVTNASELAQRLNTLMIRRTKMQVLKELPELTRTGVPIEISNMAEYKRAVRDIREWLKKQGRTVINPEHVLTRLNTLRQVVGDGKVSAAVELAEGVLNDGKKAVLFAHHKNVVRALEAALRVYGVGVISGDVSGRNRQNLINEFLILDSSLRVMIITVAGAEGIDLYSASDIIFVEREWTPAREEQAEARLHRMGQKYPVTSWYIVAKHTVDEKLEKVIRKKRDVIGSVITQDEIVEMVLSELKGD